MTELIEKEGKEIGQIVKENWKNLQLWNERGGNGWESYYTIAFSINLTLV